MKKLKQLSRYSLVWQSILLIGCVGSHSALAQSEKKNTALEDENVYELSPFVVDSSEDEGYYATSTLAGTRIRTNLKDIGTSIQVITKDFMQDVGAKDASDLLNYTTSTEVGGSFGNYSGLDAGSAELTSASSRANPQNSTRVRGLFKADLTRNFYKTIIPFDAYNTARVDINRGSNSILFGLGSPAGIINNTMNSAMWDDFGEIGVELDNEGTIRGSIDLNREVIKDKLAVRVDLLQDNRKYYQQPAYQDSTRGFIAAEWKITPTMKIRANYERGQIRANRPDSLSPMENLSPWLSYGKPFLDRSIATGIGRGGPTGIRVDKDGDGVLDDIYASDIDENDIHTYMQRADGSFYHEGNWTWDPNTGYIRAPKTDLGIVGSNQWNTSNEALNTVGLWTQIPLIYGDPNFAYPTQAGFVVEDPSSSHAAGDAMSLLGDGQKYNGSFRGTPNMSKFYKGWNFQGFTDLKGFDWGRNMLEGNTSLQKSDFDAHNIALEKTFLEGNAGIELSYDYQRYDNQSYTPMQYRNVSPIQVDINKVLPDGSPNPNFGRPFVAVRGLTSVSKNELETLRATAFYNIDFSEKFDSGILKWLGRHTFTGTVEKNTEVGWGWTVEPYWDDPDLHRVFNSTNNIFAFNNQVLSFVYLGPSVMGSEYQTLADVGAVLSPVKNTVFPQNGKKYTVTYWDPGTVNGKVANKPADVIAQGRMVTKDVMMRDVISNGISRNETVTDSIASVWQSYFLKDHIVGTVGYRKDKVEQTNWRNPPRATNQEPIVNSDLSNWNSSSFGAEEDRMSYGVVAHIPESWTEWAGVNVSLHYSESSNFTLDPSRVTWQANPIPNPSGETFEKGFLVTTLDNKFVARVNWYETSVNALTSSGAADLLWNLMYQNADFYAESSQRWTDPTWRAYGQAVAKALLDSITPEEQKVIGNEITRNTAGEITDVRYFGLLSSKDTEDVVAKGVEIELTWNPTKNWRISANVAKQETIKSNVHPYSKSYVDLRNRQFDQPLPGFEWMTLGQARRDVPNPDSWTLDTVNGNLYETLSPENTVLDSTNDNSFYGYMDARLISHRTAVALEGTVTPEQRKWRANIVTNYKFTDGVLKDLNVGGAYRWQDKVTIGYPIIKDPETGLSIGDIENPVNAPAEDAFDFFAGYKLPWFKKYGEWTVQARVVNAFASSDDVIPVRVQADGNTVGRVRLAPQRLWTLSSTFKF